MTKTAEQARSFLKQNTATKPGFKEGFEIVNPAITPTIGIPITVNLTKEEEQTIQKILVDEYSPGTIPESEVAQHVKKLTDITKQIKSISAQSVLLHGERIRQAQDLLKDYREGAFTKWLLATYGNRQTPYSMLRYYEFYHSAPREDQKLIEAAPKKAVYLLASRDGDTKRKLEIIQKHGSLKQPEFILLIQEAFPTAATDRRKPAIAATIEAMSKACQKLEKRKQHISDDDIIDIEKLIKRLQDLASKQR